MINGLINKTYCNFGWNIVLVLQCHDFGHFELQLQTIVIILGLINSNEAIHLKAHDIELTLWCKRTVRVDKSLSTRPKHKNSF